MIKRGHDPWTICDSCGFQKRRSQTRKMWDGKIVCSDTCWDERWPRPGVKVPSVVRPVPNARPQKSAEAGTTTLSSAAARFDKTVTLASTTGLLYLSDIGVTLNNGIIHWTHVNAAVTSTTVSIEDFIPSAADSGNTVYIASACEESFGAKLDAGDL